MVKCDSSMDVVPSPCDLYCVGGTLNLNQSINYGCVCWGSAVRVYDAQSYGSTSIRSVAAGV